MFAAPLVFADSLPSVNTETENINKNIFNADASSPYENREPMQLASRDSGGVSGIEMRKAIEEIQKNNNMEITNENNKTENSQEFISMDVPDSDSSNTGFKSYMDYRAITNKRSINTNSNKKQ